MRYIEHERVFTYVVRPNSHQQNIPDFHHNHCSPSQPPFLLFLSCVSYIQLYDRSHRRRLERSCRRLQQIKVSLCDSNTRSHHAICCFKYQDAISKYTDKLNVRNFVWARFAFLIKCDVGSQALRLTSATTFRWSDVSWWWAAGL